MTVNTPEVLELRSGSYDNLAMNGNEVYKFATRSVPRVIKEALVAADLEVEDVEMEPEKDFVLIRDGDTANHPVLATLTGSHTKESFISSTGNKLYVYIRTDQADSRKGFRIRYYEGKKITF